jgi:hypothetical protein
MIVSIVFDQISDEKANDLVQRGPVWLISSESNRAVARKLWSSGNLPPGHVTTFKAQSVSELLPTVFEHHAGWETVHLCGASLDLDEAAALNLRDHGDGCLVLSRTGA